MEDKINILPKIDYYVKLLLKKRWVIITSFCIFMTAGIFLSVKLPEIYNAGTLIIVVPKSIPDKFVPSLQKQDTHEQILTIEQQIKSRSNIEKLIEKFKLFSGDEYVHMFPEDKIEIIRKKIVLKVTRSRGGIESFRIEYEGRDPKEVKDVVNWLATTFIDESVKLRESQVFGTNEFLSDELNLLRARLQVIESAIKDYRKEHYGELPEELSSNLAALQRLQEQLNEKQQNIRDAKNRLILTENQMAVSQFNPGESLIMPESGTDGENAETGNLSEADRIKDTLRQLKTKYTDQHPDVVRLTAMLSELAAASGETGGASENEADGNPEAEGAVTGPEKTEEMPGEDAIPGENSGENSMDASPFYFELMMQRDEVANEINTYREELKNVEEKIEKYEKRIEHTSRVEQELIDLNRNYTNLQRTYNNLLDKKLESDIAVNLEKKQKGEKFRVVDEAKLPQKPVAPNIRLIFAACILGGIGMGLAVVLLFDFIDNTIKIPEDIDSKLQIPLLSTIPEIRSSRHFFLHRVNQVLTGISLMIAFTLFSVFALFAIKGADRALELVKKVADL